MDDIKIYDNFLDYRHYHSLKGLDRAHFFYYPSILSDSKLKHGYDFQFTHTLYSGENNPTASPYFDLLNPILEKLKGEKLYRAKVNLRPRSPEIYESEFHTDLNEVIEGHKTAIYYLNTNDGYTLFKSGEKVKSIGNRIVVFDGQLFHCGTTCTDQNIRSVLNINYI